MYLPYEKCVMMEDSLGNLMIWQGINHQMPEDETQIAYIQTSQEKSDIYANCYELSESDHQQIEMGYSMIVYLHEDYVLALFE